MFVFSATYLHCVLLFFQMHARWASSIYGHKIAHIKTPWSICYRLIFVLITSESGGGVLKYASAVVVQGGEHITFTSLHYFTCLDAQSSTLEL